MGAYASGISLSAAEGSETRGPLEYFFCLVFDAGLYGWDGHYGISQHLESVVALLVERTHPNFHQF